MQRPSIITGRYAAGNASRCFWCAFCPVRVSAGEIVLQILEGIFGGALSFGYYCGRLSRGSRSVGILERGQRRSLTFLYTPVPGSGWVLFSQPTNHAASSGLRSSDGLGVLIQAPISASVGHMLSHVRLQKRKCPTLIGC